MANADGAIVGVSPIAVVSGTSLTKDQQLGYTLLKNKKNMFVTGSAGTGKSFLIETFYNYLTTLYGANKVFKTSTTGISALNIGGKTIHSWAGIGFGEKPVNDIIRGIKPPTRERWNRTEALIIDEISMLDGEIFDKLCEMAKVIRRNIHPFGGIHVIIFGDFAQLAPVGHNPTFCFESPRWNIVVQYTVELREIIRQKDIGFQKLLNELRFGECSDETNEILRSRVGVKLDNKDGILPTVLYSLNIDVDRLNNEKLDELIREGKENHTYKPTYRVGRNKSSYSDKKVLENCLKFEKPLTLVLAVGTQVIFTKNMIDVGIANGTRGIVSAFNTIAGLTFPIVTLLNGVKFECMTHETPINEDKWEVIRSHLPLKLAWAQTIHSSQGSTLDFVEADIGSSIFSEGQTYVVLSRVRNIEGLSLIAYDRMKITANEKVIDFYNNVVSVSAAKAIEFATAADIISDKQATLPIVVPTAPKPSRLTPLKPRAFVLGNNAPITSANIVAATPSVPSVPSVPSGLPTSPILSTSSFPFLRPKE